MISDCFDDILYELISPVEIGAAWSPVPETVVTREKTAESQLGVVIDI